MSVKYLNLAWKMPLNPNETLVLLALADAANDDGFCYPGYEHLMDKTKLSRSTLAKTLSILEEAGFYEKKAHSSIGTGKRVNTYQLLFNESWFEVITQNSSKSTSLKLIDSTRLELIEKINNLRNNKKRAISSILELRKVQPSNSKSSKLEHEPSYNHHKEQSLKDILKPNKKPKAKRQSGSKKTTDLELLISHGISEQLAKDFISHRKTKKASVSKTVINGFNREAKKAGISLEDAIRISIEKNWQGFNSDWDWQGNKTPQWRKTPKIYAQPDYSELWGGDAIESTATRITE